MNVKKETAPYSTLTPGDCFTWGGVYYICGDNGAGKPGDATRLDNGTVEPAASFTTNVVAVAADVVVSGT